MHSQSNQRVWLFSGFDTNTFVNEVTKKGFNPPYHTLQERHRRKANLSLSALNNLCNIVTFLESRSKGKNGAGNIGRLLTTRERGSGGLNSEKFPSKARTAFFFRTNLLWFFRRHTRQVPSHRPSRSSPKSSSRKELQRYTSDTPMYVVKSVECAQGIFSARFFSERQGC